MDHIVAVVALIFLLCCCCTCLGDSLAVQDSEGRQIERINFEPKAKVVFKSRNRDKEMLHGSVIWFKPKEGQREGGSEEDVRSRITYRRQNKSLGMAGKAMNNSKMNEEHVEENQPTNNQELLTTRTRKRFEQTKQEIGDKDLEEIRRKTPKRAENDKKVGKTGSPSTVRRKNYGSQKQRNNNGPKKRPNNSRQNRRRNKNRKQNINQKPDTTNQKPNRNIKDEKKDVKKHSSENEKSTGHKQNVRELNNQATININEEKQNESKNNENDVIEGQENEQEAKPIKEDKVLETIKEINNPEKVMESTSINTSKLEENKPLSNSEKLKVVENADLLGLLLAQSDPSLVKVLIDNSSPENLNVFLSNSNITVEELKDIIAY